MQFSIPSKTFILGEYIALSGGPTLIACTKPLFKMSCSLGLGPTAPGVGSQNPAAKLMNAYPEVFSPLQIEFHDPHQGSGGFGASSAQFLACYRIIKQLENPEWQFRVTDIPELLSLYQQCAWNGQGQAPSGADVIAQTQAGLCYFDKGQQQLEQHRWPFSNLSFLLIKTGYKIATHEHLATLPATCPNIANTVSHARLALIENNATDFVAAINEYAVYLAEAKLTLHNTLEILSLLRTHSGCVAAKGCGALGADVIVVIVDNRHLIEFKQWLISHRLPLIASNEDLIY